MPITLAQKAAIEETIHALLNATSIRSKRPVKLASMFMDLVDRTEWPAYYDVIPEPRCLKNIQAGVDKGRYREASDVYTDLSLVFWNALFYNEPDSQIAMDADFLKTLLEAEWKKRPVLPHFRTSPPPSSAQKVHRMAAESSAASKDGRAMTTPATLPAPAIPTRTVTPAGQVLNTSSTMQIQHPSDPDVDIVTPDSEGPEDEGQGDRDPQSDEIIKQLEKGLPSWPGFGEDGWMSEVKPERFSDIVHAIKNHKDIIGNRLAVCLESIPEDSSSTLHLSSTASISLKQIETRSRHKLYKSAKDFDTDMARVFEKARRWHDPGTEAYGMTLLLQRFYQAITSPNPPPGPPYTSPTNFASLPAGPGAVKPFPAASSSTAANLTSTTTSTTVDDREGSGVTTHRVPPTRDRTFVEEINYKGWKIRLGDWVHLSNPDDPSKPIVGQVFKCWMSESDGLVVKQGHYGISVSWYYRPEQTFHTSNRQFWEGEVFKTPHFADHPIEDLIEKVACQFTAQHIRGRPRPPFWYPGFPLYVCDSQYNDLERVFVKITDWNGCIPEEVRQHQQQQGGEGEAEEFMPIYPFEKNVWPKRVGSPFLVGRGSGVKGAKGPGGIVNVPTGSGSDQAGGGGDSGGARKKLRSDGNPGRGQQQQQTPHPATGSGTVSLQTAHAVQPQNQYQQFQQPYMQQHQIVNQTQRSTALSTDRSVITAAGGIAAIGGPAQVEKLPAETAKLFDRDPATNEVLWFSAPPMNMSRDKGPGYSLEYLTFIATKRKQREASAGARDVDGEEGDKDEGSASAKRPKTVVLPTVTETLRDMWKEMRADGYM